jgi:hypothetical protein
MPGPSWIEKRIVLNTMPEFSFAAERERVLELPWLVVAMTGPVTPI